MKATGIVRRMDDLGRVVIPKEIRRALRIREGEALEIYTDIVNGNPCVCFCKYEKESPLSTIQDMYNEACDNGDFEVAAILRRAKEELTKLNHSRE